MFTTIPSAEDLKSLSADELSDLRDKIKGAKAEVRTALAEDRSPDTVKACQDYLAGFNRVQDEIQARAVEAAAADDPADEVEVDEDEVEASAPEVEAAEEAPKPTKSTPKVRTHVGVPAQPESQAAGGRRVSPDKVLAGEGVKGKLPGESFEGWGEVAQGIVDKAQNLRGNADGKYEVAYVPSTGPKIELDADPYMNLHLFDDEELKAALCTAPEPVYDMACWNTDRRPVFNSLPVFQPSARGSVSIYPSPTLQDITGGYGQWTFDDDDDAEAEKECTTIECGTPETYEWYAIYRCLTIKHSMLMTFPELVEAWLNRLAAATARYAETLLLEAMATSASTIQMPTLGYGASTSVTTGLLNYLALYQEQQRWDVPMMEAWLHRWWLYAAKADMMRARRTDGGRFNVPSDAQVINMFRENGIEPHFFIDNPSWATDIPNLQTTGRLGQFPRNLEVLVAPRGKFGAFDRGRLSIGVTGNNLYRDTGNLRRNEITFFVESYEGVVDTNSCPAHLLQFNNLCYNGQQIADLVINCEGGDEVGAAS